jgi:tartrate dehydratase beta subunit/fumarate hydratase class I family protein
MNKKEVIIFLIFLAIVYFGLIGMAKSQTLIGPQTQTKMESQMGFQTKTESQTGSQIMMGPGEKGKEVSNLQKILKEFPDIYPEGYVTGYYGRFTENAVKRLQRECHLPETGYVDEDTLKCLFPKVKIQMIFPNGGEVLDRKQIQTIRWKVEMESGAEPGFTERPFWAKASIDLLRIKRPEKKSFVKHIASVDFFDTNEYSWKITPDIPNGSGYVIRITAGFRTVGETETGEIIIPRPFENFPIPEYWEWNSDESDGTFTIAEKTQPKADKTQPKTGETQPKAGETQPKPDFSEIIKTLTEIGKNLEKISAELKRAIELLEKMK